MSLKTVIGAVVAILLFYGLFAYGAPFLLALVIAVLLEPLVQLGMKYIRVSRKLSSILVCTLFTLTLFGLTYGLGSKIVTETAEFLKTVPVEWENPNGVYQEISEKVQGLLDSFSPELADQIQSGLDTLLKSLTGLFAGVSGFFIALAKSIPNLFVFAIVFIIGLYLMSMGLPGIRVSFLSLFEPSTAKKMDSVLITLRKAINGFIMTQLIMGLITFILMLAGFMLLRTSYSLALAFIVTIVDILPIFGTGSVLVPWSIYELVTGNSFLGIGLLILYLIATLVRRIVEPKVLGNAVGIGSLAALISLYVGFKVIGVAGLFLGPLVVIIIQAMRKEGLLNIHIKMD